MVTQLLDFRFALCLNHRQNCNCQSLRFLVGLADLRNVHGLSPSASDLAKWQDGTALYSSSSFSSGFPSAVGSAMPRIRAIVGAMLKLLILPNSVPGLTPAPQTTQVASRAG